MHIHSGELTSSAAVEAFGFSPAVRSTLAYYPLEHLAAVASPELYSDTAAADGAPAAPTAAAASETAPAVAPMEVSGETKESSTTAPAPADTTSEQPAASAAKAQAQPEEAGTGVDGGAQAEGDDAEQGDEESKPRGRRREGDETARIARREQRERTKALLLEGGFDRCVDVDVGLLPVSSGMVNARELIMSSLLVATRFHPWELVGALLPLLRPSATFVIYSPTIEVRHAEEALYTCSCHALGFFGMWRALGALS